MEDAGSTGAAAKSRSRSSRSHKRGQGQASAQAVEGLQGIIALALQGVSEVAASVSETPEVALREGETERDPGEAEILALLPAQWMAKTQFGRQVGKYLISDEHKAVALTLVAYVMRVAPPLYAKAQAANVSRRRNTPPRRNQTPQPGQPDAGSAGSRGVVIPIGPGVVGAPVQHSAGRPDAARSAANGAYADGGQGTISVPHF